MQYGCRDWCHHLSFPVQLQNGQIPRSHRSIKDCSICRGVQPQPPTRRGIRVRPEDRDCELRDSDIVRKLTLDRTSTSLNPTSTDHSPQILPLPSPNSPLKSRSTLGHQSSKSDSSARAPTRHTRTCRDLPTLPKRLRRTVSRRNPHSPSPLVPSKFVRPLPVMV